MDMTTGKSGLDAAGLETLFLEAHTYYSWLDKPVSAAQLRQVYDLARMGPTSGNCCPMRIVFVRTPEGRERLKPGLRPGNVDQTMSAPATAIIGTDMEFYRHIPQLAPHAVARIAVYEADQDLAQRAAFRNATLQGAYLIMAARSLGFDCGPMSGFLHDVVDEEFFAGTSVKSNFLINIGYGNPASVRSRGYRFDFDEVCQIA
jgi:3-hydroxypropanoate dehydrogenase